MTDQAIIKGLIERDNRITEEFFFVKCKPLFYSVMKLVFNYPVDYDELVNELYLFLMADDCAKLRGFEYRSSVYQWLKILSIRFFIKKRKRMIEDKSQETPYDIKDQPNQETVSFAASDLESLFEKMPTQRYVEVLRRLVLEDCEPEVLAQEMDVTTANLYNIKRRAMAQLTHVALKETKRYGK